jgi:hypothetical protein
MGHNEFKLNLLWLDPHVPKLTVFVKPNKGQWQFTNSFKMFDTCWKYKKLWKQNYQNFQYDIIV